MILLLATLYVLASIDAAASGYAAAAGRSALIRKGPHYRRAMLRGFFAGQVTAAVSLTLILTIVRLSPDPSALRSDIARVALRMLQVYLPFATILAGAFALRTLPSVDIRSLTSTLVFGPLAGIRPLVGVGGLLWGVWAAPRVEIVVGGAVLLALWLSLERALGYFYRAGEVV